MSPAGFEPIIPASERPQTHAFRPRGHWDRQLLTYFIDISLYYVLFYIA